MNDDERTHIELILSRDFGLALRNLKTDIKAIMAKNAANGMLRSGATVKQVCEVIEKRYVALVSTVCNTILPVCRSLEAYALIDHAFTEALPALELEAREIARIASGRAMTEPNDSVLTATMELFDQFKSDLAKELALNRFAFVVTPKRQDVPTSQPIQSHAPSQTKNTGGKPLAVHWDAMWAAIAVQLWLGDLKPKSQADVKGAMLGWFNANSIDIGDTAVTERARHLWKAMQRAE